MANNNNDDPVWILLILFLLFAVAGWSVWFFYEAEILTVIRYFRLPEVALLGLFDKQSSYCTRWLWEADLINVPPSREAVVAAYGCFGAEELRALPQQIAMKYFAITVDSLNFIRDLVGSFVKWPLIIGCLVAAYLALFVSKRNKFKIRHNLESFIKIQAPIWPVISPIVSFNPTKASARILGTIIPDKLPPFAEALAPEEWLSFHRIPVVNNVPDREAMRRAFLRQLGPRWSGYGNLPPYMLVLAAAFALKGVQKRDESDNLLGKISTYWSPEKGFCPDGELMNEVKKILKDPAIGGKALEVANKFAYRTTALLGMLKWARYMGGVLASAQFLWLRGVDRELWYSMNNLGRRSFHTEGAGAIAHFMAEDIAQKALPTPRLDTAIVTMNIYMGGDAPVSVPPREEPKTA